MSSTEASSNTSTETPEAGTIDMKLEVVTLPVSDVDRAKRFYQSLGWRLDADIAVGDAFRVVQLTPTRSACSIAFGKGVTTGEPGSVQRLILAVDDIDAARADLIRRGIEVSGLLPPRRGALFLARTRKAAPTRPMPRSAIRTATGGCSRRSRRGCRPGVGGLTMDIASRASLLRETAEHHDPYEKIARPAQLVGLVCRLHGRTRAREHARKRHQRPPRYTEEVLHISAL